MSTNFPCDSAGKEIHLQCGRPGFDPWVGKILWRKEWLPTPVFWPGEFHGLCSPQDYRVGQDWAPFSYWVPGNVTGTAEGVENHRHEPSGQKDATQIITQLDILNVYLQTVWRRQWHSTPVLLPGKSHRWRSLVGCSPWGRSEWDMTEPLHFHFSLSCIGEGNGNPLQCSCLENPRDRGAWWAAVYGVAQSQTRLKRLSTSTYYEENVSCFREP